MIIDENRNDVQAKQKQKTILEEITRNNKELDNFLSLNSRFKSFLTEFMQNYLTSNEQSKNALIRFV
jgi:hypothetical protein